MNMDHDLLPGFRFYPTEEELLSFYLHNKLNCSTTADIDRVIPVVDIYDYNPWDLPQVAEDLGIGPAADGGAEQWFFFIPRQERETRGGRPNRLTTEGFWKATGSPCDVYSSNNCVNVIGRKRTMVFYAGRAPNGTKTLWKMNEYKAIDNQASASSSSSSTAANPQVQLRDEVSLCRIYKKSRSSLWAFDRRPPVRGDQLAAAADHHQDGGTTNDASTLMTYEYDQHMISTPADQTNPDNSMILSHIDDIPSSQLIMQLPLENDNINNAFNEPLWDSQDQFNRFDM